MKARQQVHVLKSHIAIQFTEIKTTIVPTLKFNFDEPSDASAVQAKLQIDILNSELDSRLSACDSIY